MMTWSQIDAVIAAVRAAVAPAGAIEPDAATVFRRVEPCIPRTTHIVIDRTPCRRCGVRGDLPCDHRAAAAPQLVAA